MDDENDKDDPNTAEPAAAAEEPPPPPPPPPPAEEEEPRARRTRTRVNYAKEQEFSDVEDNVFDDDNDGAGTRRRTTTAAKRRKTKQKRNNTATATSNIPSSDDDEDNENDPYGGTQSRSRSTSRPSVIYTEKGYDLANFPPLRERFPFLPELEEDGSPKIECIVGRRPVDESKGGNSLSDSDDDDDDDGNSGIEAKDDDDDSTSTSTPPRGSNKKQQRQRSSRRDNKKKQASSPSSPKKKKKKSRKKGKSSATKSSPTTTKTTDDEDNTDGNDDIIEYEYLVKYKGKSYLHLDWKLAADLESMNKSAKGLYRRYIKKLHATNQDVEELENPEFDPMYIIPQKIIDEAEQDLTIEYTDKELLKWEREREKELAKMQTPDSSSSKKNGGEDTITTTTTTKEGGGGSGSDDGLVQVEGGEKNKSKKQDDPNHPENKDIVVEWPDGIDIDFKTWDLDFLRRLLKNDTYYPNLDGISDNPYRDGYVTEPPKKPRASYLFFQYTVRSYFMKKYPNAVQSELMSMLGEAWRNMDDANDKGPFQILANEDTKRYEYHKLLLEKAQKPNGVWQPLRRCKHVLDRLSSDSFADIFMMPVNVDEFPDYEDVIDYPMDLSTVRDKLGKDKKYMCPEQFARDMRRIWNNCKIYNQHGSAIWHVADYMSKQFERLYHAWVLEFRERYLRWADPRARPWEHSCRKHDGRCGTPDDKMVLCDHCDAMYGFQCLDPPLKKVPSKAWHCSDCKPKLRSAKGTRMLSAVAENAARKRAELGDLPKKQVTQTMYLVKWAGLGYEFCTWETKEDIGNDALIAEFHKLEKGFSEEADMPEEVVDNFLHQAKHISPATAGGNGVIPQLRSQFYAQTRGFQFLKFGSDVPDNVGTEMGPKTAAQSLLRNDVDEERKCPPPREVMECLQDIVFRVARQQKRRSTRSHTALPPPLTGEYDTIIPVTSQGLMLNVGEIHGAVSFLGYRQFSDGTKGPAERGNIIKNIGDKIIAIDGVSTIGKTFKEVISMLRDSGKTKFAYMRFLETRFSACEGSLSSVGPKGSYAYEVMQQKLESDRQRVVVKRKAGAMDDEKDKKTEDDDESVDDKDRSDEDSEAGSEGSFQPDSEDEELVDTAPVKEVSPSTKPEAEATAGKSKPVQKTNAANVAAQTASPIAEQGDAVATTSVSAQLGKDDAEVAECARTIVCEETSRSLGLRLLNVDLGYSSDEAGDEDCAYVVDGVDETFTAVDDLAAFVPKKSKGKSQKNEDEPLIPASRSEFSALGDKAKLAAAVVLSKKPPRPEDFETFPEAPKTEQEAPPSPAKSSKRSTVKVDQVDSSTGEIVHVWANVESAAATLQLPLPTLRQVLRDEYDEDVGEEVGGFKWRYALAGAKVTAGAASTTRGGGGKKAKEAWLEFRDKLYDPSEPHNYKNGNRLRDYQVDGVNWLASTWYKRQGCILADEMGLGKTVQVVCYIEHMHRVEKIHRPFLVVVPLSTVEHWRREFEGWTDMVCCVYHDRQRVWRDVMREYEWYFADRPHNPEFLKFDVLVTTYDTLIGDFDVISQIPFRVAVVDEAHRLRNQKGKLLECMREISAKGTLQYGFQSRVLMSGTPLQNDLTELWTLLNFIEPFKFPDLDVFQASFGNMANRGQVEALQQMISPFMLRRVKEDVAKDIPAKEETVIDVELTSIQKQYYRAIFEHNHAFLNMGATRTNAPKLMNIQMELRKVCNHPFLLDGVEHRETDRQFKEFLETGAFDGKSPEQQQQLLNEHGYIMTSGKMVLLDKLLPKLRQEGHKILIFSQMVKMIDLISEYCEFRDFRYERLDGRVRGTERQKAIDRFEREEDSFLFLLSTRAGGVGINLTAADICIIFDSDWNPQNDVQAQARCHRIGQTKDVRIYRLVTSRSFEQEMFDRASKKLGLEQAVLGTFEKEKEDDKPTQQEMEQLLKKGAYALLEDDDDHVTKEFCADDIESILAKRTRTRVVEGAKTASWLNKQGMVVSKSKFTAETGESLDMDDPLFWQKVMPDFVTPSIMLSKFRDLEDEIEGKVRGPGRGRGRWRKKREEEAKARVEAARKAVEGGGEPAGEPDACNTKDSTADVKEKKLAESEDLKDSWNEEGHVQNGDKDEAVEPSTLSQESLGNAQAEELGDMPQDAIEETVTEDKESDHEAEKNKKAKKLTRAQIKKVHQFMSDLKSMMENLLEEEDEEAMSPEEKNACQKLLLTISIKNKMFNEDQRDFAKNCLKQLEGDRRRRCRTSEQPRFRPGRGEDDEAVPAIREELLITGKKRRKRRKKGEMPPKKKRRTSDNSGGYIGEDGYLHHSDSEEDWSDVGETIYEGTLKKDKISRKEAKRRRVWTADDDAVTAAGRTWPVFPRHVVKKVLSTMLDRVIEYDAEKGGIFSVPVPKDEFPEYYEQIKKPMDYGSMRKKLENGEYRSAQGMRKDFILILQNCRQFNDDKSEIVREARAQHLMRPRFLKEAAAKHDLFLSEDGSVLEIFDEKPGSAKKKSKKNKKTEQDDAQRTTRSPKKAGKKTEAESQHEDVPVAEPKIPKKKKKGQKKTSTKDTGSEADRKGDGDDEGTKKRTRIRIKVKSTSEDESNASKKPKSSKKSSKRKRSDDSEGQDAAERPKKQKATDGHTTRKSQEGKEAKKGAGPSDDDDEPLSVMAARQAGKEDSVGSTNSGGHVFLDLDFWKEGREALDDTFKAARKHFSQRGPWTIPSGVPDDKFSDVAMATIDKMDRHDRYSVFSDAVTDEEAPGYSEAVKYPMDFGTMKKKIKRGDYGVGSDAAAGKLYKDFKLVFDNCYLYNDEGNEVTEEATRIFRLLPEAYVSACIQVLKRS